MKYVVLKTLLRWCDAVCCGCSCDVVVGVNIFTTSFRIESATEIDRDESKIMFINQEPQNVGEKKRKCLS